MPYEDSSLTASHEPPYRIHAWQYSLRHAADLLYAVFPLIHIILPSSGIKTQTSWCRSINEPLVKPLDQWGFHINFLFRNDFLFIIKSSFKNDILFIIKSYSITQMTLFFKTITRVIIWFLSDGKSDDFNLDNFGCASSDLNNE